MKKTPTQTLSINPAQQNGRPVAYAYARFSTRRQKEGDSIQRQQTNAEKWAAANGHALHYLVDEGISARRGRNAMFGQFKVFTDALAQGQLGKNPTLLVENLDRISREQLSEAQARFHELINSGVTLVTLHNSKTYKAPLELADALIALVEMDCARQYVENLAGRVAAAWERQRSSGQVMHRKSVPGWMKQVGSAFELIPSRVTLVREIFQRYQNGEGTQQIAVSLNQAGVPTWSHHGQHSAGWHATQIKNILKNRALLGEFQPHKDVDGGRKRVPVGQPLQGYFPSVFFTEEDRRIFLSVQDRLSRVPKRGKPTEDHWNLLAGIALSGVDDSTMWGQKHNQTRQRTPKNYLKSRSSILGLTRPTHFVCYEDVEPRILALLNGIDAGAFKAQKGEAQVDGVAKAEAAVGRATKQVAKLKRLVLDDDDPSPTLVAELKTWEKTLESAKVELGRAFDRRERNGASRFAAGELDLTKPEDRAKLNAAIQRNFDSVVFYRDAEGRDFFVAWLDSERSDGFACFIDKCPGPFSFWSPREHRLSAIA